jgi:cyclase
MIKDLKNIWFLLVRKDKKLKLILFLFNMRLIARVDVRNGMHIKTIKCEGVTIIRTVLEAINKFSYNENEHDEIILIDTVASLYGFNNWLLKNFDEHLYCPIPLAIGGGINSLETATNTLAKGADKILINTSALENPSILKHISKFCGSQAVILQVDAQKIDGNYICFTHGGREKTAIKVANWIKNAEELGVGEIHVTNINTEGTDNKFPLELAELCSINTRLPLIISGGIRSALQIKELHDAFGIEAFSFSSLTNLLDIKINQLRCELYELGIKVRCPQI